MGLIEDPASGNDAVTGSLPASRVPETSTSGDPGDLAVAYTELQDRLLESTDVTAFLGQVAVLCAAAVPASACGITMRGERSAFTVASNNELAAQVDEIQYGRGQGPCLQTLHTGLPVTVPDLMTDDRWPEYRTYALARGIRSSLSLPLTSGSGRGNDGSAVAALNLYGTSAGQFGPAETSRANAFARHSSAALTIMLRHSEQLTLEGQLREALASRAVIDQAIGIIMGQRRCTSSVAFAVLREASQRRNVKLSSIASELIETTTGEPPQAPRPFTRRD